LPYPRLNEATFITRKVRYTQLFTPPPKYEDDLEVHNDCKMRVRGTS